MINDTGRGAVATGAGSNAWGEGLYQSAELRDLARHDAAGIARNDVLAPWLRVRVPGVNAPENHIRGQRLAGREQPGKAGTGIPMDQQHPIGVVRVHVADIV